MIMNKKIFTLLVGACILISSLFTVNAHAREFPYSSKQKADTTNFYDLLSADIVKKLPAQTDTAETDGTKKGYFYLLGVTGVANANGSLLGTEFSTAITSSPDYVMYVDSKSKDTAYLRIEALNKLDTAYEFKYNDSSYKFGVIRRASWCLTYYQNKSNGISGSNILYDFTNIHTDKELLVPYFNDDRRKWSLAAEDGNMMYTHKKAINILAESEMKVGGWHFSQTYLPTQTFQANMPLYSYVNKDTVAVLVLASHGYEMSDDKLSGGYYVTVKHVAIADLIDESSTGRYVNTKGPKCVENVLLFTLKKLNKFVMNADDWNAFNKKGGIQFDEAANVEVNNNGTVYKNPFTDDDNGLKAYEVNDALYHYGYMQFQKISGVHKGKFLYVDTAWANYGGDKYLAFKWGPKRNGDGSLKLAESSASANIKDTLFWGRSQLAVSPPSTAGRLATGEKLVRDWYAGVKDSNNVYKNDSANYVIGFLKDSIMENQSKFRVVYDPFVDSTFINVYQSRVRYENLNPAEKGWPAWWVNSIDTTGGNINPIRQTCSDISYYRDTMCQVTHSDIGMGDREMHGKSSRGGFHSLMEFYQQSAPSYMDKVMISTADTVRIYVEYTDNNKSAFSHMYGWSVTSQDQPKYRDSVLYVDLQDLGTQRIITLDQSYKSAKKGLDTKISLDYGPFTCRFQQPVEPPVVPEKRKNDDDLCLIRNANGEYLSVPLWSISDSAYWVTPAQGEDPTRMPSYQWIVREHKDNMYVFDLVNREFERVQFPYMRVKENGSQFLSDTTDAPNGAKFNKKIVYRKFSGKPGTGISWLDVKANNFVEDLESQFKLSDSVCFIRLNDKVKSAQLLGYKYIHRDSTIIDVYAFKYLNKLAMGDNARYLSWNGYDENSNDTTVWAKGQNEFDKLFFELQEMTRSEIGALTADLSPQGGICVKKGDKLFGDVYKEVTKNQTYMNKDSIILERFGFYDTLAIKDIDAFKALKPLARQAYRLFLKDYFYFYPTIKGHYMVPGQTDRYILADKAYAASKYVPDETNRVEGLFGIPHFYFRNTYFDIGNEKGNDYFAMIQRLDTARNDQLEDGFGGALYANVEEYLTKRFGSDVAKKVTNKIKNNGELGLLAVQVNDGTGKVEYSVRGESVMAVSTYQLSVDKDPIYRKLFDKDGPSGELEPLNPKAKYAPDTLEFHIMNQLNKGMRLYENTGHYTAHKAEPIVEDADRRGPCGGRIFNIDGNGMYKRDTLGHVISFLGLNPQIQYPEENYAFYVDTAYINRGTGWIKPQYMLAVDPFFPARVSNGYSPEHAGCDPNDSKSSKDKNAVSPNPKEYVIGRYLFNTAMYAKSIADTVRGRGYELVKATTTGPANVKTYRSDNYNKVQPINVYDRKKHNGVAYKYEQSDWERLAFAWAIHKGDSLYVLKGAAPIYKEEVPNAEALWKQLVAEYKPAPYSGDGAVNPEYIDFKKLVEDNVVKQSYEEFYYPDGDRGDTVRRVYHNYKTMAEVKKEGRTIGLQAIINLSDNTHKDWVFSFRYVERDANEFVIESETTDRNTAVGAMIRPGRGGWIKSDNSGVPVISRSDSKMLMSEAAVFNVNRPMEAGYTAPVGNEEVTTASAVTVIGGTGNVTILNAAGKHVVISNLLGQTVANVKITSDKAVFAAPAGFVVVAVEGENAVKALVK
jgi:hypothetical protein